MWQTLQTILSEKQLGTAICVAPIVGFALLALAVETMKAIEQARAERAPVRVVAKIERQ